MAQPDLKAERWKRTAADAMPDVPYIPIRDRRRG
jgi:hypothetical protein